MRKPEKIAGFAVEAFPHVKSTQVEWVVQFRDLPNVRATGASLPEARERLAIKWEKTAEAFKAAGLALPCRSQFDPEGISGFWTRSAGWLNGG
jgi:predicted RNase H-like HicB family nuclease